MDDPVAWPAVLALKACFCTILAAEEPVCSCCIQYGTEVAIDVCDPGLAWLRVVSEVPIEQTNVRCAKPDPGAWLVTLELGVARCAPTVKDNGDLPTCAEHEAVARKVLADKHRMLRAFACCEWAPRDVYDDPARVRVLGWQPLNGPEGLCTGGIVTGTVEINTCLCVEVKA